MFSDLNNDSNNVSVDHTEFITEFGFYTHYAHFTIDINIDLHADEVDTHFQSCANANMPVK